MSVKPKWPKHLSVESHKINKQTLTNKINIDYWVTSAQCSRSHGANFSLYLDKIYRRVWDSIFCKFRIMEIREQKPNMHFITSNVFYASRCEWVCIQQVKMAWHIPRSALWMRFGGFPVVSLSQSRGQNNNSAWLIKTQLYWL